MLKDFTQLEAWKRAMDLAERIHTLTKEFPREEIYGVTSQMRRAALSIAANIAEGFGRYTYADKMHKYVQARGELIELMTFVHYCRRVGYIRIDEDLASLLNDCTTVHKLLNGLITKMDALDRPKS
ncbi:MAG: four helix bundle protein [Candidatus Peregrinibacteria bacterium]